MLRFTQKSTVGQLAGALNIPDANTYRAELEQWATAIKKEMNILMAEKLEGEAQENRRFRALTTKVSASTSQSQRLNMNRLVLEALSKYDFEKTWKQTRKAGNTTLLNGNTAYQNWKDRTDSCTLVYTGRPGCGKSVLLANMVDDINIHIRDKGNLVAYFFSQHDTPESLKARTIIGSLACQFLRIISDLNLTGTAKSLDTRKSTLDVENIIDLLQHALPADFKAYVILDGIDDCDDTEREQLTQHLHKMQVNFKLLVCISHRLESNSRLKKYLENFTAATSTSIPDNNPDIEEFIEWELESCLRSRKLVLGDPSLILEIQDALQAGSNGMFLWTALQIESLCFMKTDNAIRQALRDLPKDLSETFSRILHRSRGLGVPYQKRILELVTAAQRPLTAEELREAISVVPGDAIWNPAKALNNVFSVLTCCGSLLVIDEEDLTIRLVHQSVKTFLFSRYKDSEAVFTIHDAKRTFSEIVITYLNYGIFNTQLSSAHSSQVKSRSPMLKIVQSALGSSITVSKLALHFLRSRKQQDFDMNKVLKQTREEALGTDSIHQHHFWSYTRLYWVQHILDLSDLSPVMYRLLLRLLEGNQVYANATDGSGRTPLSLAATIGNETVVSALLESGKAEVDSRDNSGRTPLSWAARNGQETVVKLLLETGKVDVNSKDQYDQTPLSYAAADGHEAVVKLLIETGKADVESKDKYGQTPLSEAKNMGPKRIVTLLRRDQSFQRFDSENTLKRHVQDSHPRPFICIFHNYGCDSRFESKCEWKRHVDMKHLHLEVWRCDMGACAAPVAPFPIIDPFDNEASQHHDFDTEDCFTQHMKRMHAPPISAPTQEKQAFAARLEAAKPHFYGKHPPVNTICPYCPDHPSFESWDDRMEHIGTHLEKKDVDFDSETEDAALFNWLMVQGYVQRKQSKWKLINTGGEKKLFVMNRAEEDNDDESELVGWPDPSIFKMENPAALGLAIDGLDESELVGWPDPSIFKMEDPAALGYANDNAVKRTLEAVEEDVYAEEEDIDEGLPNLPMQGMGETNTPVIKVTESSNSLLPETDKSTITVKIHSNLKGYMRRELEDNQSLRSMLTVTGDHGRAYAAACEEYLEWRWPKHGLLTLDTIEAYFLSGSRGRQTYQNILPDYDMEIVSDTEGGQAIEQDFTVRLTGPARLIAETVQHLAWLSAVFRDHQPNELCSSLINTKETVPGVFELSTLDLQRIQDDRAPCWHDLFVNGIVAHGFPIPARLLEGQEGIELPFHVMTSLAGVIYPVEYDGGVVLQGFSSLLSPSILQEDSVQWHYVSSKQSHTYLPTSSVAEFSRVKGVDIEHLTRRRTFLGYCRIIEISLGTAIPDYERLDYSPASNDRRGIELAFRSLSAGTSGMNMINANANATITFPRSMVSTTRIDHYEDILGMCRETPVLLYDAERGEQRGWLVPMLSAILHMAHIWQVWARKVNMNLENSIPHAVLHWDGGQASFDVFLQNSGILLYKTLVEKADYQLKDLVIRMWAQLNSRIEEQKLARTKTPGALILESKRLRGWEIMEIVKPNPIANLKMQEIHSDCSWNRLSEEVLVLFCQGLGDVIKPSTECTICPTWNPVPRGRDYLTASVQCLEWLSKKQGAKQSCTQLTDQLCWQPVDSVLFADCDHADGTGCGSKAQHLVERKKFETRSSVHLERMGAVIFGQRSTKLHKEKTLKQAVKDDTDDTNSALYGLRKILRRR